MLLQYLLHNLPTIFGWLWRSIIELYIQFINYLSHVSLFHELMYIGGVIGLLMVVAYEIQYHLNRIVGAEADQEFALENAAESKSAEELENAGELTSAKIYFIEDVGCMKVHIRYLLLLGYLLLPLVLFAYFYVS